MPSPKPHPRLNELELVHVEYAPEELEYGKLYVSKRFHTSLHRCPCGCGEEVVLPINLTPGSDRGWDYTDDGTFTPSVGNQNYACRSHYYITECRVIWHPDFPQ
jgi:hypothetical protein